MPSSRKKRTYKRPGYIRCGRMVVSDGQKALALARHLKTLVNVEFKHHNVLLKDVSITDAGLITPLSLTNEGNTSQTRDGGSVKWTSYRLIYNWKIHASATNTTVRVMVVHDKQTNQAQFTLADLLFDATVKDAIYSPPNINNASRFNILYDKVHALSAVGNSSNLVRIHHKKLNMKMRFDANVGNVTDLTSDSMALVFISDETTNDPTLTINYRSRFVDN